MAETVEYVVRIKGLGGSEEEEEKKSALTSGLEGLQKALHPVQNLVSHKKDEGLGTFAIKETTKLAIKSIESTVSLELNRYFKLSEDYKSQNNLNNVMSNINRAKGLADSAIGGAMMGAKFGGVYGAVFGALIGAGGNTLTQAIQWNNTVANFNSSMNATNVQTNFRAKRAGLYDGGKGTEN